MSEQPGGAGGMEGARSSNGIVRLLHPVDTVVALLILAFVGFLFYETTQFDRVSALFSQNIPPTMFPRMLLIFIAALALVMPFEHILLKRKGKNIDKDRSDTVKWITWATIIVLTVILATSEVLGTLLTLVSVCLFIPMLWGERRLRVVLPFAIIFPVCVAALFELVLKVFFAPGVLNISLRALT
ncbi:MAG: tripartite tricarboxylate transporter TctB family protein [Limibacillus sp.]|jgi:putative tricarboxylic transport membrane protein